MSGWASSSSAFFGFMLPPYWMVRALGGVLAVQLADDLADDGADLVGLLGGSGLAGADGPDGLIGDDDVLQLVSGHAGQRDLDLHTDQLLGDALLALVEALAHADDGLQAAVQSGRGRAC